MGARVGIERTLVLYGWYYDEDDIEGMAGCFSEDAVLRRGSGEVTATGRAEIRRFFDERRGLRRQAREQTRHVIGNVLIENETADSADVLCYLLLAVTEDGGGTSVKAGWYRDRMVREGSTWRFKERAINVDSEYVQRAFEAWQPAAAGQGLEGS
jgi:3-phenylpropionate/cinnamic acid dioxygenase small subunit